ncbi:MAG: Outer membrane protein assembly factor BamA [Holosporales bacterium]
MLFFYFIFLGLSGFLFSNDTSDDEATDDEIVLADFHHKKDTLEGRPYTLKFKGYVPEDVIEDFKKVSLLIKLADRIPSSITGLGKRADTDKKLFKKVLLSKGYLGAKVDFRISSKKERDVVKFKITLNNQYTISSITIESIDNPLLFDDDSKELVYNILNIAPKDPVDFAKILDSIKLLKRYLQEHGYPFVSLEKPIGNVEHKTKTMNLTIRLHTGILAYIKATKIKGLTSVQESFVRHRLRWKEGDLYNINKIEKTKGVLAETELIGNIETEIDPVDMRDCVLDQERLAIPQPVILSSKIKQMPPRAIGVDLSYSTVEKIGGRFYWHHNNLFGNQEHLGFLVKYSPLLKKIKVTFDLFDFLSPLQSFSFVGFVQKESDTLSYSGQTQSTSVTLSRPIWNNIHLKGSAGFVIEKAKLWQNNFLDANYSFSDNHSLVGFPFSVSFDTSNNKLNPAEGIRALATLTPFAGKMTDTKVLTQFKAECSYYIPLMKTQLNEPLFVLATFFRFGKLFLTKAATPPLNKRFFLGGAGSVRAYGHKKLSPFATNSANNNVIFIGGRTMSETGIELRYKVSEDWSVVSFCEGGMIDSAVSLQSATNKKFLWGPGFGVRYHTSFAPVRVDVAFPIIKRCDASSGKKIDAPFQLYISIGQSF